MNASRLRRTSPRVYPSRRGGVRLPDALPDAFWTRGSALATSPTTRFDAWSRSRPAPPRDGRLSIRWKTRRGCGRESFRSIRILRWNPTGWSGPPALTIDRTSTPRARSGDGPPRRRAHSRWSGARQAGPSRLTSRGRRWTRSSSARIDRRRSVHFYFADSRRAASRPEGCVRRRRRVRPRALRETRRRDRHARRRARGGAHGGWKRRGRIVRVRLPEPRIRRRVSRIFPRVQSRRARHVAARAGRLRHAPGVPRPVPRRPRAPTGRAAARDGRRVTGGGGHRRAREAGICQVSLFLFYRVWAISMTACFLLTGFQTRGTLLCYGRWPRRCRPMTSAR